MKLQERPSQPLRSKEPDSATSRERKAPLFQQQELLLRPHSHILNAARNLINLDDRQVDAVAARIELDLRIGYAFTRFLTNNLRTLGGPLAELMLSYGMSPTSIVQYYQANISEDLVNSQLSALL